VNAARIFVLVLFCASIATIGCTAKNWRSDQFEGGWQLTTQARSATSGTTILKLDRNGHFIARSLPHDFLHLDAVGKDHSLSGNGTWSIVRFDNRHEQRLVLTFTELQGYNGPDLPYGAELFIEAHGSEPRLFYFEGDPDDSDRIVFQKQ